ncbi:MAG: efflux RND transporter periplasmic adaptor subunit [Bacteroidaceae bacterium]|nr:efflux RND transporter periplasmic adaptor subunit [Bacteroidaceae bacterium]
MKNIFHFALATIVALAISSCGHTSHSHNHAHDGHDHGETDVVLHDLTQYNNTHELFVRMQELTAGSSSHVTTYVTRLSDFKPEDDALLTISLAVGDKSTSLDVNSVHHGMYEFKLTPKASGKGVLNFTLHLASGDVHFALPIHVAEECNHNHSHDDAHAHSHDDAHAHSHDTHAHSHNIVEHKHIDANLISFLKEQSWKIDFATETVAKGTFNGSVKVAARVTALPENEQTLVATSAGRVHYLNNIVAGTNVASGKAVLLLDGGDVTENDASVKFAEAESNYEVAKADYIRKQALYNDKIVSKKDLESAHAVLRQAEAHYNSMKRSYSGTSVVLKSPFNGYVSDVKVANGDYVAPGTPLVTIQRSGAVNINAELPVRFANILSNVESANVELTDGTLLSLKDIDGEISAVGRSVNSCNMIPFTIKANNLQKVLPGSIVTLHISSSLSSDEAKVVVPRTALVEEMGNYFVFVQHSPISFEKREVVIGESDGMYVQVIRGLHEGERVVTKGAVSIKLSQGAAALDPHAGHVH